MATEEEFLDETIEGVEAAIKATTKAIAAISAGAQTYTLDTGQTRQTVTKADITSLRNNLNSLLNTRRMLLQERDGGGAFNGR